MFQKTKTYSRVFIALALLAALSAAPVITNAQFDTIGNALSGAGSAVTGVGRTIGGAAGSAWDSISSGDVCNDINDAVNVQILDCGSQEDIVSFIGFEGGLAPPSGEGLDTSLTRAKTAREFIVNAVNFALTFLGVIAMVIVIYGGFLYVTAAGNEEQSTKGKKSITYAAVGILIIIASFALVNTLLTFGGGSGTDRGGAGTELRGTGIEGTNIAQQTLYNLGAQEINTALNNFVSAYKNLVAVNSLIRRINSIEPPSNREGNRAYLNNTASVISQIKNSTNSLSQTHIASRDFLDGFISQYQSKDLTAEEFDNDNFTELLKGALTEAGLAIASRRDFQQAIDDIIGPTLITERPGAELTVSGRLPLVWKIMGDVAEVSAGGQAQSALERGLITEKDIKRAFAGIDPNVTVGTLFKEAIEALHASRRMAPADPERAGSAVSLPSAELNLDPQLLINAIKSMDRLYIVVKDIKFVSVRISASIKSGSAPLIVELSGLDSRDPTGQTIPDENFIWDPDGDGNPGVSALAGGVAKVNCGDSAARPTITCTFNSPGTYLVRLAISSKDPLRVAGGQAILPVTVNPSVARINLKATVGAVNEDLRRYEQDSEGQWQLIIDKNELQVTADEATTAGVTFDAAESRGGDGSDLKSFKWTFGDGSQAEEGASKSKIDGHKYPREGKYPLTLEVTDFGNRKDRKIVNVIVSSIAASIGTTSTIGEPDELMEFDGSLSRSDQGTINSYRWQVLSSENVDVINFQNELEIVGDRGASILRAKFKKPGSYTIQLTVSNGTNTATASVPIAIRSRKPRAAFTVRQCPGNCVDPIQPSLVEFDASISFDPDSADRLTYDWSFYNALGDKLSPGSGFTVIDGKPLTGQDAKRVQIKFPKTGRIKAVLRVNDSHTDPAILQEDIKEKEIEIDSVVEVEFTDFDPVQKLKNGVAAFNINGHTLKAERVQIDFGDGESGEDSLTVSENRLNFSFEHEYAAAGSYLATVKAISEQGNGVNSVSRRLYVSAGDGPLAVIEAFVNDAQIELPPEIAGEPIPALEIIRNVPITFRANRSVNTDGKAEGLRYSWDFGDSKRSTGKQVQHSYEDISPENALFIVKLTLSEIADPSKSGTAEFPVRVISKKPIVNTLALEKKTSGITTPIDVELTAEGALDPDGRITNYQFWYYNPGDPDTRLGIIDTQTDYATLTVETIGAEGEEHEYIFCVTVTDNENTASECTDLFTENELPHLKVTNGANQAPNANFNVDRTNARVNEEVRFTSSSTDADGTIKEYVWDTEGDGFQNNNPTELSTITHKYDRRSPSGGYRVKLKAIDDKGAAGYSKDIPIFISALSNPPIANFTYNVEITPQRRVKFFDSSTADTVNGARIVKWTWDFDTAQEFGCTVEPKPEYCNGNKQDDADSTDQNPIFDFPASGTYQVKLTAEDSDGNISDPKTALISLIPGVAGGSDVSPTAGVLNAELKTAPAFVFEAIPGCTPATSIACKRKTLHIPASSNGQNITLFWGDSTGDTVTYKVDKNIWCGSDDDQYTDNDTDNPDTGGGTCTVATGAVAEKCWTTNYQRYAKTRHPAGPGHFTTRLTTIARNKTIDTDTVEVVFDGETDPTLVLTDRDCNGLIPRSLLGGSIFRSLGARATILLSFAAGVIVILIGFSAAQLFRRGKPRI